MSLPSSGWLKLADFLKLVLGLFLPVMEEVARIPRSSKISVHVTVFQGNSLTNIHSYLLRDIS